MASSARPSLYGSHRCCSRKTSYCSFSSSFIYSPLLVTSESENDAVHHKRYHLTGNILNEASGSGLWPKSYSISVGEGGLLCTSQMSNRQLHWANSPPLWHLTLTVYKRSQWRWTVHSADNKIIICLYPCEKETVGERNWRGLWDAIIAAVESLNWPQFITQHTKWSCLFP